MKDIHIEFAGGLWDGEHLYGSSYDADESRLAKKCYWATKAGTVGELYGAKTTPHMFIIDAQGKLVYDGAIDDDPRGQSQSPLPYVDNALQQLVKGESVDVAETRPYGCSVKYKK